MKHPLDYAIHQVCATLDQNFGIEKFLLDGKEFPLRNLAGVMRAFFMGAGKIWSVSEMEILSYWPCGANDPNKIKVVDLLYGNGIPIDVPFICLDRENGSLFYLNSVDCDTRRSEAVNLFGIILNKEEKKVEVVGPMNDVFFDQSIVTDEDGIIMIDSRSFFPLHTFVSESPF